MYDIMYERKPRLGIPYSNVVRYSNLPMEKALMRVAGKKIGSGPKPFTSAKYRLLHGKTIKRNMLRWGISYTN